MTIIAQIFSWYNFIAGLILPLSGLMIWLLVLLIRVSGDAWSELRKEADDLLKRVEDMHDVDK